MKKIKCKECGCSDKNPCKGGCYWVEPELCSKCEEKKLDNLIKLVDLFPQEFRKKVIKDLIKL